MSYLKKTVLCLSTSTFAFSVFGQGSIDASPPEDIQLETVSVVAQRREQAVAQLSASVAILDSRTVSENMPQHIAQVLAAVPGAWIVQGSGQEHLSAIRSPVFTGAGACGNFLVLVDSVPVRASGFCNVNQLFDTHYELADQVEVMRGPDSVSHGSNALFGKVNVRLPYEKGESEGEEIGEADGGSFARLGLSEFSYRQLQVNAALGKTTRVLYSDASEKGFRDSAGFQQKKLSATHVSNFGNWQGKSAVNYSQLHQATAGFIEGEQAYRDPLQRSQNANPEAYRDKQSLLAYSRWSTKRTASGSVLSITPFVRHNEMEFLMHFLPWAPTENNSHSSVGIQSQVHWELHPELALLWGLDAEVTQGSLREFQKDEAPFAPLNFPQGPHYDFDVDARHGGAFVMLDWQWRPSWAFSFSSRIDSLNYKYDNKLSDGSACVPEASNCRFSRPEDRADKFTSVSHNVSINVNPVANHIVYGVIAKAFRAPQVTELYRLQQGQQSANLSNETLDSLELGWRWQNQHLRSHAAIFSMNKRDGIYTNSERQLVFGAESQHQGVEWEFAWDINTQVSLAHAGTYATHTYANDPIGTAGAESINGNDMDSAPRRIHHTELSVDLRDDLQLILQRRSLGAYYLNESNSESYQGHSLMNIFLSWQINKRLHLGAALRNVEGAYYAERADFAFGEYRYFPGELRKASLSLRLQF